MISLKDPNPPLSAALSNALVAIPGTDSGKVTSCMEQSQHSILTPWDSDCTSALCSKQEKLAGKEETRAAKAAYN